MSMERRVYIATGFDNGDKAAILSRMLAEVGVVTTVHWWLLSLALEKDPATRSGIARDDLNGVKTADLVVAMVKGDPATFGSSQLGTHGELGAACALGIPVLLVSPTEDPGNFCIFHYHPVVKGRLVTTDLTEVARIAHMLLEHGSVSGLFQWAGDNGIV